MSRENKKMSMKKWNHSSRRKQDARNEREKRARGAEGPRRKSWGAEPASFEEFSVRLG